ncbi:diguanylate cyclase domain-containing protein [Giesbergeria sinuosa]|uniref:diguanylate cyclase n=1 Tax=Giesbergeria sinuosa TaxID=80883 RepID=A0ABV9QDJ1_9BURK
MPLPFAAMNLQPRFLLLTVLFFVMLAAPSWWVVRSIAEGIVEQWAVRYAEKQVLYDTSRTLQPILREVALSRQLAASQDVRDWARQPQDSHAQQRAMAELESFRKNFQDKSYFVGLYKTRQYFHNNAANEFAGRELRYQLNPKDPKDAWFFDLIRQQRDMHINVNPDPALGITKLWIDVLIRDGNDILGIAGTGLDLTTFIHDVVEENVAGVTSLFVDHGGAIQIHRNQQLIDFGSVSKSGAEQKTLHLLFEQEQDYTAMLAAMKSLETGTQKVATLFVQVHGKRHLAGVAYLPEIDWYEITLLDLDVLLPLSQFKGLLLVYGLTMIGLLLMFNMALRYYVVTPLARLGQGMSAVQAGQAVTAPLLSHGGGEIGQLIQHFVQMQQAVADARHDLENKVQERTAALEQLTKIDPLTGLLNRRGMLEQLEARLQSSTLHVRRPGILWLDVDYFKEINDARGHATGDLALRTVAVLIQRCVGPEDAVSRWGGDEFLVLLPHADQATLNALGQRLCAEVAACATVVDGAGQPVPLTASIGGHLQQPGETVDTLLHQGDQALYAAKARGRNNYCPSVVF